MTQLFSGTRWRLGGLSPDQVRAVTPEPAKAIPAHEFDEFDRELFLALQHDGRLSFRDLAAAVGRPEPTVRRRMGLLTHAGMLAFRTDFARVQAGWPTAVALKLSVTGSAVAAVGRTLVRYPETRFCVELTGGGAANISRHATAPAHSVARCRPTSSTAASPSRTRLRARWRDGGRPEGVLYSEGDEPDVRATGLVLRGVSASTPASSLRKSEMGSSAASP